ncbi:MAG TPA: phosphoglucomutase/phosphomannomutase family protein [Dehalococcoidia bacterium]
MSVIKFGTDGWRAVIAEDYTFENVRACAQATVQWLRSTGMADRGLVVGYDTRFQSDRFAAAVAEVAAGNGVRTYLVNEPTPTPAVSFGILHQGAGGAVVITSSHNPAIWNGFKVKPHYAGSASPEVVEAIESAIPGILESRGVRRLPLPEAEARGLVQRTVTRPAYLEHLGRLVDLDRLRAAGLRVAVDAMYGTGAGYLRSLLEGGRTAVQEINAEVNPNFPGIAAPEPITRNLARLMETVRAGGADVGLATDGDADRLGIVDEGGAFVTQLQVFALLCYYLLEVRGERGPIVKSITTTKMADKLGRLYGVPVYETAVGFKYLGPKMMETDALIGGEESGGYGFRGHLPERDGILAGLYFLDLMARTGKRPSELIQAVYDRVGPHYYDRVDLHLDPEQRPAVLARAQAADPREIAGVPVTGRDTIDGFRFLLGDTGWLLIRFSGTEPLVRIYTEVTDPDLVPRVLEEGRHLVGLA